LNNIPIKKGNSDILYIIGDIGVGKTHFLQRFFFHLENDIVKQNFLPIIVDFLNEACPPEDCGGIWGYMELLEILKDPNHPEYEDRIEDWLGEDFDSEYFNLEEVNKKFRKKVKPKK